MLIGAFAAREYHRLRVPSLSAKRNRALILRVTCARLYREADLLVLLQKLVTCNGAPVQNMQRRVLVSGHTLEGGWPCTLMTVALAREQYYPS